MKVHYLLVLLVFITTIPFASQSNVADVKVPPKGQATHSRKIRSTTAFMCSNLTSCAGRCSKKRMFHNIKDSWNKPACYCDPECDKVFTDCCADYVEKCAKHKKIPVKKISKEWSCFKRKEYPFKLWMVDECRINWPKNDSNVKYCALFKETYPKASWITPVFASKTTYRNRYCALCNGVTKFKSWKYEDIECKNKRPKGNAETKLKYYDKYCNAFTIKFKTRTRGIRYCYDVIKSCKYYHDKTVSMDCAIGATGLLSSFLSTYKNFGCLTCNRKKEDPAVSFTCGPRKGGCTITGCKTGVPLSTIVGGYDDFHLVDYTFNQKSRCSEGQIYDNVAKLCRNLLIHNTTTSNNFLQQLAVRLTFEQTKTPCLKQIKNETTSKYIRESFLTVLKEKLNMYQTLQNTSTQWRFHDLDVYLDTNNTIVTFKSLRAPSLNETLELNFFKNELKIGKIDVNGLEVQCLFVLAKFDTKEATCPDNNTYSVNVDELESRNGSIYLNTTRTEYRAGEYLLYQYINETRVALCRDSKPADCLYHLQVKNQSHWKKFDNRSIYSLVTNSWFHYGEYSLVNGSLWLCLTKDYRKHTRSTLAKPRSIHYTILGYGTTVSFSVSITSLTSLLVVYSMFSELRNLPGKNLMLFSTILALAQTAWIVQSTIVSKWPGLCPTFNVAMQFLFLASFSSSLSIAVHSFVTFNALSKGKLRRRSEGGLFLKYAMFGVGLPFLYVLGCLILDTNNVVPFKYGTANGHCWFATTSVLYIGFLYPAFFLLLCSMAVFFATLRVIHKCTKASQKLAQKAGGASKKHLCIFLRMSTLMGFTWLSAVFHIFCPDVLAFEYLFVFANGFQGLYLAFAFLSTENVRKIVLGRKGKEMNGSSVMTKRHMSTTNM